jgi:hypothetical protein
VPEGEGVNRGVNRGGRAGRNLPSGARVFLRAAGDFPMPDQDSPMPRANPTVWLGISIGGSLFLVGFILWAAIFGIGGGPSPNQQQASGASQPASQMGQTRQTTGQGSATQPAQQEKK